MMADRSTANTHAYTHTHTHTHRAKAVTGPRRKKGN